MLANTREDFDCTIRTIARKITGLRQGIDSSSRLTQSEVSKNAKFLCTLYHVPSSSRFAFIFTNQFRTDVRVPDITDQLHRSAAHAQNFPAQHFDLCRLSFSSSSFFLFSTPVIKMDTRNYAATRQCDPSRTTRYHCLA